MLNNNKQITCTYIFVNTETFDTLKIQKFGVIQGLKLKLDYSEMQSV